MRAPAEGHDGAHPHPDHRHDHVHEHRSTPTRTLTIALAMTAGYCVVEAVAGWAFGSLALLADAGHMLSDAAALLLALVAQRIARRERTRHRTFGYRRAEVLAAFVNGVALATASIGILFEAVRRWHAPPHVDGRGVLITAALGLGVNLGAAYVLWRGEHNTNTRAALAHVLADGMGSVGAIASGLLVIFLGWQRADPAISVAIAVLLAYGAWHLIAQTIVVLMEGAPSAIDLDVLEQCVLETPGVAQTHDLHAWTISEGFDAVTVHVVLAPGYHGTDVAQAVALRVQETFQVSHVTVQPEQSPPALVPPETLHRRRA